MLKNLVVKEDDIHSSPTAPLKESVLRRTPGLPELDRKYVLIDLSKRLAVFPLNRLTKPPDMC